MIDVFIFIFLSTAQYSFLDPHFKKAISSHQNSVDTLIAPQPQNNIVFHITFINTRCPTVWTIIYEQSLSENLNQQQVLP